MTPFSKAIKAFKDLYKAIGKVKDLPQDFRDTLKVGEVFYFHRSCHPGINKGGPAKVLRITKQLNVLVYLELEDRHMLIPWDQISRFLAPLKDYYRVRNSAVTYFRKNHQKQHKSMYHHRLLKRRKDYVEYVLQTNVFFMTSWDFQLEKLQQLTYQQLVTLMKICGK